MIQQLTCLSRAASQMEDELATAMQHIRALQKDLVAVRKVGLAVQRHSLDGAQTRHPAAKPSALDAIHAGGESFARERERQDAQRISEQIDGPRLSLGARSRPSQLAHEGPRQAVYSVDGARLPFSRGGGGGGGGEDGRSDLMTFTPSKAHVSLESRVRSQSSSRPRDSFAVGGAVYGDGVY